MENSKLNIAGIYIYLDDERNPPVLSSEEWEGWILVHARNYEQAIAVIEYCSQHHAPMCLDLDHDLGIGKTGYDVCTFIVWYQIPHIKYRIHSMNPVGRQNMEQLLSHYGYKRF